jgi:Flp pilus assembly pilin Flp
MGYRLMGRAHALATTLRDDQRGQGTVEYVGLILLIAALIAGVVAVAGGLHGGGLAQTIVGKLKDAIEGVGKDSKSG